MEGPSRLGEYEASGEISLRRMMLSDHVEDIGGNNQRRWELN